MALTKIDDRGLTTPIDLLDDEKIRVGTTDNDLEIFHGSNISKIKDGKGDLRIMSDTIRIQRNAGGENYIYATEGGAVKLHYDGGNAKLETTSTGAKVTGALQTTGNVDVNGGSINLGVIDTSSGHINAAEVMTFNIDTDNDDTTRYFAFYNNGAGGSGTELFRIQENGNASMGGIAPVPTDPAYNKALLHIHQTQSGTYGSELHLTNNTTGSTATDGMFLSMWTDNDVYFTNQEAGDINFTTNGHQALQIQSNKNVKITDGNLIIDTAGHGIDFSAQTQSSSTTDSELLDHYEKGKWDPVLKKNNVANATPDIVHGRYVRVGKKVWLSCYMRWNSGSNAQGTSGGWTLHGLPFSLQDDNPGTCRIYQFAPIGYFNIDSDEFSYGHDSRWQANVNTYLTLYTDVGSTDLAWNSGVMQMSMTGTFMIHE